MSTEASVAPTTTPQQQPSQLESFLKDSDIGHDILSLSASEITNRTRLLETEIHVMRRECSRLGHELESKKEQLKDNEEKIKMNKQLPYLVAEIVEVIDHGKTDDKSKNGKNDSNNSSNNSSNKSSMQDGANVDLDAIREGKSAVVRTSSRTTAYLPMIGLVPADQLTPGDSVGVNKDSFLVYEKLPAEFDPRVRVMEVDTRPTEEYTDIGGLDAQIEELVEAVVLPITHADRFKALGIRPPKGVLMYGPPGTGKTLMARACAARTKATFLKLAGPQLVQMYIGDGARIVRDAFALAKEKAPAIIFIDEIDAVGSKRTDSDRNSDREVQRTLLELLNQLDGFGSDDRIKVIAATNRVDILDPALLRSGRLDRKIDIFVLLLNWMI